MTIKVRCRECRQDYDIPATATQLEEWRNGALIQNAMPNLDAVQRELLISRTCGACFDKLFLDADENFTSALFGDEDNR